MNAWREWKDAEPAEFAVIGDPIDHSLSPQMHSAAARALGLGFRYIALRVPRGEVAEAFRHLAALGYRGVNVTVPHKEETFRAMREVEPFAQRVQAVNTVRLPELRGTNTDGPGFLETLAHLALSKDSRVLVLGAGGAALAVVASLADAGFQPTVFNRTRSRAEEMLQRLGVKAQIVDAPDPAGCSLVVNSTSAGLHGERLPIDWAKAEPSAVAYDLVYGREPTPFLCSAAAHGLRTVDGLHLLVVQGALSLEWWLGVEAPRRAMLESLQW